MAVRTQTQEIQASSGHRVLRLRLTPQQRLQALIEKMREAAQTLPQEVQQALSDWETRFFQKYRMDSPLDLEREAAAHALLFLKFSQIEQYIIGCAGSLSEKVKWVAFSNEIKAIVTAILPQEIDVDAFIESDKAKQLEVRVRLKTAQAVRGAFPREERVYEMANQARADLHGRSRETQGDLAALSEERGRTITQLHREFDDLTQSVSQLAEQLEGQLHTAQDLGSGIKAQEGVLSQALNECEALLNKV